MIRWLLSPSHLELNSQGLVFRPSSALHTYRIVLSINYNCNFDLQTFNRLSSWVQFLGIGVWPPSVLQNILDIEAVPN